MASKCDKTNIAYKGTSATPKQRFLAPPRLGLNTTAQDSKVIDGVLGDDDDHGDEDDH